MGDFIELDDDIWGEPFEPGVPPRRDYRAPSYRDFVRRREYFRRLRNAAARRRLIRAAAARRARAELAAREAARRRYMASSEYKYKKFRKGG